MPFSFQVVSNNSGEKILEFIEDSGNEDNQTILSFWFVKKTYKNLHQIQKRSKLLGSFTALCCYQSFSFQFTL